MMPPGLFAMNRTHRSAVVVLAAALSLAVASHVAAQDTAREAVLLMSVGDVDPEVADSLSEVLIGAVAARGGLTILGRQEFQAQLAQGDAGTLECISSLACLGRVGVQLDVREVIAGTIARREGVWIFNLNRVDTTSGQVVGRVFREVEGDLGAVADALHASVPELFAPPAEPDPPPDPPAPPTGAISVSTNVAGAEVYVDGALVGTTEAGEQTAGELVREGFEPGPHRVELIASGYYAWARQVRVAVGSTGHVEARLREAWDESPNPLLWIGGGLSVAAFGVAIGLGVASQDDLDLSAMRRQDGTVSRAEAVAFYEANEQQALAANVLFAVGGVAAAAALVALFFPDRSRRGMPERAGVRLHGLGLEGWF